MDSTLLALQNPWWDSREALHRDSHLSQIQSISYYFERPELFSLVFASGDFHILRGPRQVGKTTLIKQWIRQLIFEKNVPAQAIFYLSCEGIETFQELQTTLALWLEKKNNSVYIFLDEISFVSEWQRAVLWLSNAGLLNHACLMVTGSNARDLKESAERFPGRRGKGLDLRLYPLHIANYLELECFKQETPSRLLEIYFRTGGFPHAISDWVKLGYVSDETYTTYKNWVIGDAARFGLAEETLKHLFFRIAETLATRITWPALIESTPIRSHETALQYLEHLKEAFLCHIHYCYDPNKAAPAIQKSRKVYFIDPILYYLGYAWRKNIVNISQWVENFLASSETKGKLLESFFVVGASQKHPSVDYWYSTKEKKEVDLLIEREGGLRLFDIKWKESVSYNALKRPVEILHADSLISFLHL